MSSLVRTRVSRKRGRGPLILIGHTSVLRHAVSTRVVLCIGHRPWNSPLIPADSVKWPSVREAALDRQLVVFNVKVGSGPDRLGERTSIRVFFRYSVVVTRLLFLLLSAAQLQTLTFSSFDEVVVMVHGCSLIFAELSRMALSLGTSHAIRTLGISAVLLLQQGWTLEDGVMVKECLS